MTKSFGVVAAAMFAALIAQGSAITIDNSGTTYNIVADTTGEGTGSAVLVTNLGIGWSAAIGSTAWIAPLANQNNSVRPTGSFVGDVTYRTTFTLPSDFTAAVLDLTFLSDDSITVSLNGTQEYASGAGFFGSGSGYVITPITTDFVAGTNTLQFVVHNIGGPTGLDVLASGSFSEIPEPATTSLLGAGLLALGFIARRRRQVSR